MLSKRQCSSSGEATPSSFCRLRTSSRAAQVGVQARVQNNGQSCIAAKRFIVHTDVYDSFEELFIVGHVGPTGGRSRWIPPQRSGPLATSAGREEIAAQVEDARAHGATVLCGGNKIDGPGFFYEPTVLSDITPQMRVYSEEVFGPVAMLYRARDEDEVLRIANDSPFGLAASVWTSDPGERERFIERLEVGMVFVNAMVASTPELPFGGLKQSGYGRELGDFGLREFCAVKTVWVA